MIFNDFVDVLIGGVIVVSVGIIVVVRITLKIWFVDGIYFGLCSVRGLSVGAFSCVVC